MRDTVCEGKRGKVANLKMMLQIFAHSTDEVRIVVAGSDVTANDLDMRGIQVHDDVFQT